MEALSLFGILGFFTYEDIRSKRLRTAALFGCAMAGLILHLLLRRLSIEELLGGMAIGLIVYVISVLSGGKIGKGDALIITITGIFLGFRHNLILLWAAGMFIQMAGLIAFFIMKKGKNYELPFVPFLLAAYCICLIMWGGSIG